MGVLLLIGCGCVGCEQGEGDAGAEGRLFCHHISDSHGHGDSDGGGIGCEERRKKNRRNWLKMHSVADGGGEMTTTRNER